MMDQLKQREEELLGKLAGQKPIPYGEQRNPAQTEQVTYWQDQLLQTRQMRAQLEQQLMGGGPGGGGSMTYGGQTMGVGPGGSEPEFDWNRDRG